MYLMFELAAKSGETPAFGDAQKQAQKGMLLVLRAAVIFAVPATAGLNAAVFCYWLPNNLISMTVSQVLRHPRARAALNLPPPPKGLARPSGVGNSQGHGSA